MKTKFELKMNLKRLERQQGECKQYEKDFTSAQKLCNLGKKTDMYGKLFKRVENKRDLWWKSLDKKIKLEQTVKILEKKLLKELLAEK